MDEPIRITCLAAEDVPAVAAIEILMSEAQHLVLQFPVKSAIDATAQADLLRLLTAALPEYRVFYPGRMRGEGRISVVKVISASDVIRNADAIVAAAQRFRTQANDLIAELARHLELPLEVFRDPFVRLRIQEEGRERGILPTGWGYWFHGAECQFVHEHTGQTVAVRLGFYPEFGLLDPWFFKEFLETTPELASIAGLCKDYHNANQVLEVLEQHGHLERLTSPTAYGSGLVARDG